MRTTVTLEPDVSRRMRELSRARKLSFKEALNVTLRHGLEHLLVRPKAKPFCTAPEDMGVLPHPNSDNIGDLFELAQNTPRK